MNAPDAVSYCQYGLLQGVIAEVPAVILRCISRDEAALAVAQKVVIIPDICLTAVIKMILLICIPLMLQAFKGLYENASNIVHVDAHLAILAAIRDVSKLVVKELTSWVGPLLNQGHTVVNFICLFGPAGSIFVTFYLIINGGRFFPKKKINK